MTVNTDQQALPVDPLASQRAEFLGKLVAAQSSLERVIAELASRGASTGAANVQMARLASLQASVGTASAADLGALRGEIAAAVAQSQNMAQEAQQQVAASASASAALALADAARASRIATDEAMASLGNIPLRFTSAEDEAAYLAREKERQLYITEQEGKHTPEGDLNATGAALGQMVDAKEHGAKGPEFDKHWKELVADAERLRTQMHNSGIQTQKFDDNLRDDLRLIMKSKGLSDAEIDAQFAAHPDPLDAAKGLLTSDTDLGTFQKAIKAATVSDDARPVAEQSPDIEGGLVSVMAKLQSAGIKSGQVTDASQNPEHGLTRATQDVTTIVARR
jgi:hypothetical protein